MSTWRSFCRTVDYAIRVSRVLARIAWRFRAGLAPLWLAVATAAAGSWWPWAWWWPITAALVAAPALNWAGDRLAPRWQTVLARFVPDRWDDGRRGVLDRPTERAYLALQVLACGSWVSWLALHGWDSVTDTVYAGFVAVLAAPWWWHRGFRRRTTRISRWVRRWAHVAEAIKEFQGSRVVGSSGDRAVTELKVMLRPGQTIDHVGDRALQVASALSPRLRPGAITLAPGDAARQVVVRIVPRDPWQGVITHPRPEIGTIDLDREDAVFIGSLEDRTPLMHRMRQHTLTVAQSGSGKSVMLDTLIAWMAIARAPVVAIDMAQGVSLGEWQPVLAAPLATDMRSAFELLRGVMNVVEHREREMRRLKAKTWPHADLFVPIDEFPTLVRVGGKNVISLLTILAERARKTRVWLYPASQNGTRDDLGSTEFRAQMMCQLGGRLDKHMNSIMWGDLAKQGWDGTGLANGTWLLRDAARNIPRVAKGAFLSEAEQIKLVREATRVEGARAVLDQGSAAALCGTPVSEPMGTRLATADRDTDDDDGRRAHQSPGQPRRVTVVPSSPSPLEDLDMRVLGLLPPVESRAGTGATQLAGKLGVDRGKVERSLRRLDKGGWARHTGGRGGWVRAQ